MTYDLNAGFILLQHITYIICYKMAIGDSKLSSDKHHWAQMVQKGHSNTESIAASVVYLV